MLLFQCSRSGAVCLSHTNPFCKFVVDILLFHGAIGNTNTHTSHHSKFITEAVVVRVASLSLSWPWSCILRLHSRRLRRRSCSRSLYNGRAHTANVCTSVCGREKQENREETRYTEKCTFSISTHQHTHTYEYAQNIQTKNAWHTNVSVIALFPRHTASIRGTISRSRCVCASACVSGISVFVHCPCVHVEHVRSYDCAIQIFNRRTTCI